MYNLKAKNTEYLKVELKTHQPIFTKSHRS